MFLSSLPTLVTHHCLRVTPTNILNTIPTTFKWGYILYIQYKVKKKHTKRVHPHITVKALIKHLSYHKESGKCFASVFIARR